MHILPVKRLCQALLAAGLVSPAMVLGAGAPAASTLPTGLQVVQGQATQALQGNTLTVTNSPNAILSWQSFSIGSAAQVYFSQASAASKVLNRVTGSDPSSLFGSLASNGQVWLINPNGVLFGAGARVDVASLVVSTLPMLDADFLAGRYHFESGTGDSQALLRNEGSLRSASGGQIVLLGARVENTGDIEAGQIALAGASSVDLVDTGLPNLTVRVKVPSGQSLGQILNQGSLSAPGGSVSLEAALVNQQGFIRADTLGHDTQGRIVLRATDSLSLGAASQTRADGETGGSITLDAGTAGTLLVQGQVSAKGSAGQGGTIKLLGRDVGLLDAAQVDASGQSGGTVLMGGGLHGQDALTPNSQAIYLGPDALVSANGASDGGQIVLWSEASSRIYGSLSAQGGAGHGGFVETSSKGVLDVGGARVRTSGAGGSSGGWLLDPSDITVVHGSAGSITGGIFDPPSSSSIGDTEINAALNAGTDVTLQTSAGTSGTGAIVINGSADAGGAVSISNASGGQRTFTLNADSTISMHPSATIAGTTGNALNIHINAPGGGTFAGNLDTAGGIVQFTGPLTLDNVLLRNSTLTSPDAAPQLSINNATLDTVTFGTSFNISNGGGIDVIGGLQLFNGTTLTTNNIWYFEGAQSLGPTIGGVATLQSNGASFSAGSGTAGALTLASGLTLQGWGFLTGASNVINNAAIKVNSSGNSLLLQAPGFTNNATIDVSAGDFNDFGGGFTNSAGAVITVSGGTPPSAMPATHGPTPGRSSWARARSTSAASSRPPRWPAPPSRAPRVPR